MSLRGSSRDEVHAVLATAAAELADRDTRIAALEAELARLRRQSPPPAVPTPDRAALISRLGSEAASILAAADEDARRVEEQAARAAAGLRRDLWRVGESLRATHARLGEILTAVTALSDGDREIRLPDGEGADPGSLSPGSWLS